MSTPSNPPAEPVEVDPGRESFLDRVTSSLNSPEDEPPVIKPNEPDKSAPDKVDDLAPGSPPKSEPSEPADPLDTLGDDPVPEKVEPEKTEDPKPEDPLSSFSAEEQAVIEKAIDDALAQEHTSGTTAANAFKKLREENRSLKQQVSSIDPVAPEELTKAQETIEQLKTSLAEKEQAASVVRLEDTDAWKDAVVSPLQNIVKSSDAIAERYSADPDQLSTALEISDPRKLSEEVNRILGPDAAEADKMELYSLARDVKSVYSRRDELNSNADQALKEAQEIALDREKLSAQENKSNRTKALKSTVDRVKDRAPFVVEILGDEKLSELQSQVEEFGTSDLTEDDISFARFSAQAFVPMAKKIKQLEAELITVSEELGERKKATPDGGKTPSPTPAPQSEEDEGLSFAERAAKRLNIR